MIIDVDGELCICGNHGCIECYSTIPAIEKIYLYPKRVEAQYTKDMSSINYGYIRGNRAWDTLARK